MTALTLISLGICVPAASADPVDPDPFGYKDLTSMFVTPFDRGAFGENADKSIILSPYGTSRTIECASFHGQGWCRQFDHLGNEHDLYLVKVPTGSTEWDYRGVYVYNPF
ncbi:hypothetical protein [Rhodococcus koreensis]|uniref:hypothetical protein n=1 Tax=Rhodococcus koreensis TaxID=99653 RepID=UPI00366B6F42